MFEAAQDRLDEQLVELGIDEGVLRIERAWLSSEHLELKLFIKNAPPGQRHTFLSWRMPDAPILHKQSQREVHVPLGRQKKLRALLEGQTLSDFVRYKNGVSFRCVHPKGTYMCHLLTDARQYMVLTTLKKNISKIVFLARFGGDGQRHLYRLGASFERPVDFVLSNEKTHTKPIQQAPIRQASVLKRALKKYRRLHKNILNDQKRLGSAEKWTALGQKLLSEAHTYSDTYECALVIDGVSHRLERKPHQSWYAYADILFIRARKARRGQARVEARLALCKARLGELEKLYAVQAKSGIDFPTWLAPVGRHQKNQSKVVDMKVKGIRSFTSTSGHTIWVGRTAATNHRLTFEVANGRHTWCHIRDVPGAHVVIAAAPEHITEQDVMDACALAQYFSECRSEENTDITVTERKNLKPIKGQPGRVRIQKAQTRRYQRDVHRLERLLRQHDKLMS